MKKLWILALTGFVLACNNNSGTSENDAEDTGLRPRPVVEGVTNSTKIVNDSVIVPDTNNSFPNPSAGVDTVGPMRKKGFEGNEQ